eukprot:gnl/Dysnectes_brevis/1695_a1927_1198.p1 GENE.gnl/Dysnectes_brevis/1695_a1927_1198~~gnl/Dysnectes_brevis/1695_a1927_1198.p1  ORF type:complete len:431 (+),score=110.06 gnl/Dysnectes_brevis/1695_a1927_1198:45-1295(+)
MLKPVGMRVTKRTHKQLRVNSILTFFVSMLLEFVRIQAVLFLAYTPSDDHLDTQDIVDLTFITLFLQVISILALNSLLLHKFQELAVIRAMAILYLVFIVLQDSIFIMFDFNTLSQLPFYIAGGLMDCLFALWLSGITSFCHAMTSGSAAFSPATAALFCGGGLGCALSYLAFAVFNVTGDKNMSLLQIMSVVAALAACFLLFKMKPPLGRPQMLVHNTPSLRFILTKRWTGLLIAMAAGAACGSPSISAAPRDEVLTVTLSMGVPYLFLALGAGLFSLWVFVAHEWRRPGMFCMVFTAVIVPIDWLSKLADWSDSLQLATGCLSGLGAGCLEVLMLWAGQDCERVERRQTYGILTAAFFCGLMLVTLGEVASTYVTQSDLLLGVLGGCSMVIIALGMLGLRQPRDSKSETQSLLP